MPHDQTAYLLERALHRINRLAVMRVQPQDALETILDEILRLIPADCAAIELINPDTFRLEIEATRGMPETSRETRLQLGQGITGWVALHGKSIHVPDVREDPRYVEVRPEVLSEIASPFIDEEGGIIGVINLDRYTIHTFTDGDLQMLETIAAEATAVINRIWQFGKLEEKSQHLENLIRIGRGIVLKRDLNEILQTLTNDALEIMNAHICAVFFYDPERESLVLKAISGALHDPDYTERLNLDDSSIGTAIRRRRTVEVYELRRTEEHHFIPIIQKEGLVSMLAAPIGFDEDVIGVLSIYTQEPHRFNNEEKRIFETLASLGAAAIQNARLYERVFHTEENLRQTERLTTLGLLAAEIAHEIRNPLTVIRLLFESLMLEFAKSDPRSQDVRIIEEKLDQLEEIVSRVLSFGKSRHEIRSRFDICQLIEETLILVRLKLRQSHVELVFDRPEIPLFVEVSKGPMQQALLNLIINATQAMPNGGKICISAQSSENDGNRLAEVLIRDTGSGIPENIRNQIFESFLSGRNDGTGLGLAIVKRILRSYHGDINVLDSSPQGTTMRIHLPLIRS